MTSLLLNICDILKSSSSMAMQKLATTLTRLPYYDEITQFDGNLYGRETGTYRYLPILH